MKATPSYPGRDDGNNDPRPANPLDVTGGVLEDARVLSDRVVKLAALLSGYANMGSQQATEAVSSGGLFDRLATDARETRYAIEAAHEALDFIEGQIS